MSEILAKVIRGETVESIYRGSILIIDGEGNEKFRLGDTEMVTFFRSSAKPLQVIPFLLSGGAEIYSFTDKEIAIACGSHSGEQMHVETSAKILQKCGLEEKDLRCGSHLPFDEKASHTIIRNAETPNQLHNNCSGKHSTMLAFAKFINSELNTYTDFNHPIQLKILEIIKKFCEYDDVKLAIDGCAAPNFALPISAMAKSYAKLIFPPTDFDDDLREACRRVVTSILNYPEMVGGTDRLDTVIMQKIKGRIICKIGAEGLWLAGILPCDEYKKGLSIAVKIESGEDYRARPVVAVEILRQLGIVENTEFTHLSPLPIKNRLGDKVGEIIPTFKIS
ncbi:MAG: asparaginase [Pyrinomonadaceae bacterium]|jgi:L-asparaginase II|nr:asparaginase [Pyrinomonadaceae bacterium]